MIIKLQDYAREQGVTDRSIQRHLKKHEKDLQGHFERRGPNGTWLDEYAQDYLRQFLIQQPIVVGDNLQQQEIEQLRKRVSDLERQLTEASQEAKEAYKWQAENMKLLADAEARERLLEASNEEKEQLRISLASKAAEAVLEAEKNEKLGEEVENLQNQLREYRAMGFFDRLFKWKKKNSDRDGDHQEV